ncbi:MAG TPA: iron-sulfur cluster assembly protein [Actinoplanes sp.]|nr:iron-sulfur cluster assembly protein [Actinoplanes sp.]
MTSAEAAWAALDRVRDPELDRPITDLGFVAALTVEDTGVRAELRLPTYFCAPNFAWLMVADARDVLAEVAEHVEVVLLEHFAAAEINRGVAAAGAFAAAFDADGRDPELAELRATFERKAHVAAQERLARALIAGGAEVAALAGMPVAEAAARAPDETAAVLSRRERLGLRSAAALCADDGTALGVEALPGWLRLARTVRVSIDGNAGFCRGLLETRYGLARAG